jgi:NADH:ubiquinone oxidoreductase subunit 11 or 4L (chain K)
MLTIYFVVAVVLLMFTGFYSLIVSRNLMRVLIAVEILTKAATLIFVLAGYLTNQTGPAQEFIISLIIIEVVFIAVAAGIIIGIFRNTGSLHTKHIRNLKG